MLKRVFAENLEGLVLKDLKVWLIHVEFVRLTLHKPCVFLVRMCISLGGIFLH